MKQLLTSSESTGQQSDVANKGKISDFFLYKTPDPAL